MSDEVPDVARLRREAHDRALRRPRLPSAGVVEDLPDGLPGGRAARRYTPDDRVPGAGTVFLHGGFGLFGDVELQDGWCRRLAHALGVVVLSVDYRLAPEFRLDDAVDDALAGVETLVADGLSRLSLAGDSAGGAVARLAAARSARPLSGLLLTNPNLDLTLSSYDDDRPGGPGRGLSEFSFRAWTGVDDLTDAPRLDLDATGLPPTLVAVGTRDSLLPEARSLADSCRRAGVGCRLLELPDAEHGFVGTGRGDEVLAASRTFFDLAPGT